MKIESSNFKQFFILIHTVDGDHREKAVAVYSFSFESIIFGCFC